MQSVLRFAAFLAGFVSLHLWERAAGHRPLTGRRERWVGNLGLGLVNGTVVSLACAFCLAYQAPHLALLNLSAVPFGFRIAIELVLLDAATYFLHRAYHRVPVLWRLHMVHHSDEDLDVSSASRFHPGEVVLSAVLKVGIVLTLGISALGLIVFETIMLACAQFQHSNVRVSAWAERWMWRTIVPPEMHRLHHSPQVRDTDSNYGTILTLWDRVLGTLNARSRESSEPFGIAELPKPQMGFIRLVLLPFKKAHRVVA